MSATSNKTNAQRKNCANRRPRPSVRPAFGAELWVGRRARAMGEGAAGVL